MPPARERPSYPIRGYLLALVISSMLPLLLFAGLVVFQHAQAVKAATREQMTTTVRALALAVDRDIANAQATLAVMRESPAYAADDIATFYSQCAGFGQGYGSRIMLLDRDRQIFDTGVPLGTTLPPAPPIAARTIDTGAPQISGYIATPAAGAQTVLVTVPLLRDGHAVNALAMELELGRFTKLLEQQRPPAGWLADVIDQSGIILARNVAAERFVGQSASGDFLQHRIGEEGMVETRSMEGIPVQAVFTRAVLSGWTVTLAVPEDALGAAGQNSLWWIIGGGLLLLTLAGAGARTVSLWIVRPVGKLAEAAEALGRGESPPVFETGMRELQAVAMALRQTDDLLAHRAAERDRTHAELQALAATLEARVAERTAALEGKSAELLRARDAEKAASRAKTGFLAAASHDLRQPLHAAALFAAALGRRVEGAEALRLVASIGEATKTMQSMLDALLDVSRLDGGVMEPYPAWFCIEGMFARLKTECITAARAKGLELDMIGCTLWVETDPALLESIVRNFISNAVKFTRRGRVLVGCRRRGDTVRIEVWDTGPGIPEDKIESAFQEFQRLGGHEHRQPGLGLGLAIVRRLVDLLGLRLEVTSTVGRGSCFAIELPYAIRAPDRREVAPGDVELSGHKTVLVVDDNPLARAALARELTDWGCRVIEAGTSEEAGLLLANELDRLPDLIITDLDLGGEISGLDMLARLAARYGIAVPTIVITGDTRPDTIIELKESGHPWLIKPVDPAALRRAAGALLSAAAD